MMGEMEPNDYQLVRIGLLAAISDRAAELGEEIFEEAEDTIAALRERAAAAERRVTALVTTLQWYADETNWHDGMAIDNLTGGYAIASEYVDENFDLDKGARARAALAGSADAPHPRRRRGRRWGSDEELCAFPAHQ